METRAMAAAMNLETSDFMVVSGIKLNVCGRSFSAASLGRNVPTSRLRRIENFVFYQPGDSALAFFHDAKGN